MDTHPDTTREKLATDLQQVLADARQLMAEVTGGSGEAGAVARLAAQLKTARDELQRLERQTLEAGRHAARATDQAVREHPYAAMGIAAGVGVLLGVLAARR